MTDETKSYTSQYQRLNENLELLGGVPTNLKVFLSLTRGLSQAKTAKELNVSPSLVSYHAHRLRNQEWITSVAGTKSPILFERGPNAHVADKKLSIYIRGSVTSNPDRPQCISIQNLEHQIPNRTSVNSLTLTCRIHNVLLKAPIKTGTALAWEDMRRFLKNPKAIPMKGVVKRCGRFIHDGRSWDLEFMGKTLLVHHPPDIVCTAKELLSWLKGIKEDFTSLSIGLNETFGIMLGGGEIARAHYAFPDLGAELEHVGPFLFESPEAWLDRSTGKMEYEVSRFRLALLIYSLPLILDRLVDKVQGLEEAVNGGDQ